MIVGYARVSTIAQDVEMQRQALLELGAEPERIYTDEGFSGKSLNRAGLREAMAAVRE
ncbi:recombinase family protein [Microbacterium sp.]